MTQSELLDRPIQYLQGVGPQTARRLEKMGLRKIRDLIFHLPIRYEDRTKITSIGNLFIGMNALVKGRIEWIETPGQGRKSLLVKISDDTGELTLRFFHYSARLTQQFQLGDNLCCYAEIRKGYHGLEMIHPEFQHLESDLDIVTDKTLTPIYPLTEGLRQTIIRKAVKQAIQHYLNNPELIPDLLPASVVAELEFLTLEETIQSIHFPSDAEMASEILSGQSLILKRLVFEELMAHYLSLFRIKTQIKKWQAPILNKDDSAHVQFLKALPFQLTNAQKRVISEINTDCTQGHPMLRLIQGDVGSGKTVVAAYAALLAVCANYQVAVMAPTELLAEQHYHNFSLWFETFECQIIYLSGSMKASTRQEKLFALKTGKANIAIGTHALFQKQVDFFNLGLVVIDEQHRFGVQQRMALRNKGQKVNFRPHQLIMTATPIPRTLAMLQYSDLDISILDELPPGRKDVLTSVIPSERRNEVIERIQNWILQGRQAYWVCTLIEESEVLQCEAAQMTWEHLKKSLSGVRIGLVHGRLKNSEKEQTMKAFKNHEIDLLVATTVIEVGVDVPNAGLMIIENPERLGLSQLHQLRGRVGRGNTDSYCLLLYQSPLSDLAKNRLAVLRDTCDGFVIAEKDLQIRGPGELMGTRQTGQMHFKITDLSRDQQILDNVKNHADQFFQDCPNAIGPLIQRWLGETTHYAEV